MDLAAKGLFPVRKPLIGGNLGALAPEKGCELITPNNL
jgi:hypothetical protein